MKIMTVCGMGVGTSLMLKMTVESALAKLGRSAEVQHWDLGTVAGQEHDFIVTSDEFKDNFRDDPNVVFITNIMDVNEVQTKLSTYFAERGDQ
ncbi:PTS sugar transporter subunit IIB [Lacticaseibacillus daqingensis]|uniref:PTS sugar transporter subunit IIB n=1 Tax=Lacticaseibacillus daqingensis TaxID=2486014 RepID=UPI000F7B3D9D|nr:PTS sugar transporter subunit IIB [Lacticaseibacillus daqingensis]